MDILIADDQQLDRAVLKDLIAEAHPEFAIREVSSTKELFKELSASWDLLFLDISFSNEDEPDDDGLDALFEVIDCYPSLPVCVFSGHFKEKLSKFFQKFYGTNLQVVNFLDKGNYTENDIEITFKNASLYQEKAKKNIVEKQAIEVLLQEVEEEKRKIMDRVSEFQDRLRYGELLGKAFTGNNWSERIEAESLLTARGPCNINAALLCIEMDSLIQELCPPDAGIFSNNPQKLNYIVDKFKIDWLDKRIMFAAWRTRNQIVHGKLVADLDHAYDLLKCVSILQKKRPKIESLTKMMKSKNKIPQKAKTDFFNSTPI